VGHDGVDLDHIVRHTPELANCLAPERSQHPCGHPRIHVSLEQDTTVLAPDDQFDAFTVQLVRDRAVSDDWGRAPAKIAFADLRIVICLSSSCESPGAK
jgi:hypothetical protein